MTAVEVDTVRAAAEVLAYARAHEQVAGFLAAHPDLAENATVYAQYTMICTPVRGDAAAFIADAARRARELGAPVEEFTSEKWAGIRVHFGPVYVQVYAPASELDAPEGAFLAEHVDAPAIPVRQGPQIGPEAEELYRKEKST